MPIKILVKYLEEYELQKVLEFYNKNKEIDDEPLELLDRAEGGFQIQVPELKNKPIHNPNQKVKQLRWNKGYLLPHFSFHENYPNFTFGEERLLLKSFEYAIGAENVKYE